jgi:hypothetical protein
MPTDSVHPAGLPIDQLLEECQISFTRRSGPGGQHRNKTETGVVLEHRPTKLRAEASERRNQTDNRRVATNRLRLVLAVQHRRLQADPTQGWQPSPLWQSRRISNRLCVSVDHDDFPTILAEALDCLHGADYRLSVAAEHSGVTASQLLKLICQHPPAFQQVNRQRVDRGMRVLKP